MYGGPARDDVECMSIESVPTLWNDDLDGTFFRIVLHVVDAEFELWASAMLTANDAELTAR